MSEFCHSCAALLSNAEFKGSSDRYCKYCTDTSGKLHSREQVQKCIAEWFKSWQPNITDQQALKRAEYYMKSMPAWAERVRERAALLI